MLEKHSFITVEETIQGLISQIPSIQQAICLVSSVTRMTASIQALDSSQLVCHRCKYQL